MGDSTARQSRRSRDALEDPRTLWHEEYANWVSSWTDVVEFQLRGHVASLGWGRLVDEISLHQAILLDLIRQYSDVLSVDQMAECVLLYIKTHKWPIEKIRTPQIRQCLELLDVMEIVETVPASRRTRYRLTEKGWRILAPSSNPTTRKLAERGLPVYRMAKPTNGDEDP